MIGRRLAAALVAAMAACCFAGCSSPAASPSAPAPSDLSKATACAQVSVLLTAASGTPTVEQAQALEVALGNIAAAAPPEIGAEITGVVSALTAAAAAPDGFAANTPTRTAVATATASLKAKCAG